MIECETPDYLNYGAKKCDVHVAIGKGDYTITKAEYTYYLNTVGEKTIAYGPGLLQENAINVETMFVI